MKTLPSFNFYGLLTPYDGNGSVEIYIDYDHDFEGRLLRHSMTIDLAALTEYLLQFRVVRACEVDDCVKALINYNMGVYAEAVGEYILLSKAEWLALDDDNQPIPVAVEAPMFHYYNQ